ncbi:hypothetical protein [Pricia antarctica]|nr:hypothetical protein [Pricia antarctica]
MVSVFFPPMSKVQFWALIDTLIKTKDEHSNFKKILMGYYFDYGDTIVVM